MNENHKKRIDEISREISEGIFTAVEGGATVESLAELIKSKIVARLDDELAKDFVAGYELAKDFIAIAGYEHGSRPERHDGRSPG